MISNGLNRTVALFAAAMVAGCSNNLDGATALPVIEQWIEQLKVDVAVGYTTPECIQNMVSKGYIKVVGQDRLGKDVHGSTEKLPTSRGYDVVMLPIFKAKLVEVFPVHQVPDEKRAAVKFSFKYVPTNPDISEACYSSKIHTLSKNVISGIAMYTLTTNGWVGAVSE